MSNYLKVEGSTSLIRDSNSRAILNTDSTGYHDYITRAKQRKRDNDDMKNAIVEINNIKNEMCEIKSMLLKLLDKNNG